MEVDIEMTENKNFLEQEEKFLKELLEKYRAKNPKEEINLEEEIKKLEDEIKKMEEENPNIIEESKDFWDNLSFEENNDENDLENEEINIEKRKNLYLEK